MEPALFKLPAELRLQIYSHSITQPNPLLQLPLPQILDYQEQDPLPPISTAPTDPLYSSEPPLCLTNRQLRSETLPIFYGDNIFELDDAETLEPWLQRLGRDRTKLLTSVVFARWTRVQRYVLAAAPWSSTVYGILLAQIEAAETPALRSEFLAHRGVLRVKLQYQLPHGEGLGTEGLVSGFDVAALMDRQARADYAVERWKRQVRESGAPSGLAESDELMTEAQERMLAWPGTAVLLRGAHQLGPECGVPGGAFMAVGHWAPAVYGVLLAFVESAEAALKRRGWHFDKGILRVELAYMPGGVYEVKGTWDGFELAKRMNDRAWGQYAEEMQRRRGHGRPWSLEEVSEDFRAIERWLRREPEEEPDGRSLKRERGE